MGDTLYGDISRGELGAWVSPIPEWDQNRRLVPIRHRRQRE